MPVHLANDLSAARRNILRMGQLVGHVVHSSLNSLEQATSPEDGLPADETQIDRIDVNIEDACLKMLALHQPVASDLRQIATMLKVNTELERIADLAQNISERAASLRQLPPVRLPEKLTQMAHRAVDMLDRALVAYTEQRRDMAVRICGEDDVIDALNREIIDDLTQAMRSAPEQIEPALHLFSVSRHIERIADHATNIAEDVIYLTDGEIVRHRPNWPARQSA
jgi:phosphate transport system protein